MRYPYYPSLCLVFLFFGTCQDNPTNGGKPPCGGIDPGIGPQPPYDNPIWHPSGQFIGFNHIPLKRITYPYGEQCWGEQEFIPDSTGFWLINADGTKMRRIFPYKLLCPVWSPDGEWVAFVSGAQILKMRFTGTTFDTTSLTQLTTEGRNFLPAWSPDGEWIAYDNTTCGNALEPAPPNSCGLLVVRNNGTDRRFLVRGRMPHWAPDGMHLAYIGLWSEIYRVSVSDTSEVVRLTSFNQIDPYARDNRYPRYSPDGGKIGFRSIDANLWIINSDGTDLKKLTTEREVFGGPFSWSPDGTKIVYTVFRSNNWGYENGTLWTLNPATGEKRQLTFNLKPSN